MKTIRENSLKSLDRISREQRDLLLNEIEREWQTTKEILITQLGSTNIHTRCCSAYLLGLYRYPEAVESLGQMVSLEDKATEGKQKERRWDRYPAFEALIRIGKPSIPAMLRNIEGSEDETIRELSARVIFYVEGADIAPIVLEKAISKQTDPLKKGRLKAVVNLAEKGKR